MKQQKARLHQEYVDRIAEQLQTELKITNKMQIPRLQKIVINVGINVNTTDNKALQHVVSMIANIAGQQPVKTLARKSIAGFKIREDMPIGVMVTLRGRRMYEFLDRLITLALPRFRDFQGLPIALDGRGNYNFGLKEWVIFPEADSAILERSHGMNITFCTSTNDDASARALLKAFGIPFKGKNVVA